MNYFFSSVLEFLRDIIIWAPGMLLGVILHEYAHGYIAYKSGDPTAKSMGRLSLNPMAHIDLFGSIFLPLLLILLRSNIVFGYAKPVPINPAYFRNFRKGIRYTSLAGPLTNLMVAFILGSLYGLFVYVLSLMLNISVIDFLTDSLSSTVMSIINRMFISAISINIFLAIFNFIPIPPLDGSKILASFLPGDTMIRFLALERLGFIFIFILLFLGGRVFWSILSPIFRFLLNLCLWWQYILA